MLTKDLLKYRHRSGKITPSFITEKDVREDVAVLLNILSEAIGRPVGEIEDDLKVVCPASAPGLVKLLLDLCEVTEDDGSVLTQRWHALKAANQIRLEATPAMSLASFEQQLAHTIGISTDETRQKLYADLPDARHVMSVKSVTEDWLIKRYNVALVQGLLLRAKSVTFTIYRPSVLESRAILRHMRFHRLLADINRTPEKLVLTVSGPLSIFEQAQTYGLHIAKFFPHVIKATKWRVAAVVQIGNREYDLDIDQSSRLSSHYKQDSGYIPEEITSFITTFNKRYSPWTVELAAEVINLGSEAYAVPDLEIKGPNGEVKYLEIFHPWHHGNLSHRLKSLSMHQEPSLRLAVCQKIGKSKEGEQLLAGSDWFSKNGCLFSSFPTPKAVWALVN